MTFRQGERRNLPGRGGPGRPPLPELPNGYLVKGYFDDSGNILPTVVVEWPQDIARKLRQGGLESSQLRRFFSEVRHLEGQLQAGKDFAAVRGSLLKLGAYAADAEKKRKAPPLLRQFIEQNLKWATRDPKSFLKGFVQHFECIVAYFPER